MEINSKKIILIFIFSFFVMLIPITYSKYVSNENRAIKIVVKNPEYDVQFDSNAPAGKTATGSVDGIHFVYGETKNLTANSFAVDGYIFLGWTMDANGNGTVYTDQQSVSNLTTQNGDVVTLYAKWREEIKVTISMSGADIMIKMKSLSGNTGSISEQTTNTTITAFKHATKTEYESAVAAGMTMELIAEKPAAQEDVYMWFDSSTGTIYYYSEADKIALSGNAGKMFTRMSNLSDISGLADLDMSQVTDTNRMFQNCKNLADLTPIANWDVSNVTDMTFMFGHSETSQSMAITSLQALANWDVSSVTTFYQTFKACKNITSLAGLENWNVSSATSFYQMFNWNTGLTDATMIHGWAVDRTDNFSNMFNNNTSLQESGKVYFDVLPGSWTSTGTYRPSYY